MVIVDNDDLIVDGVDGLRVEDAAVDGQQVGTTEASFMEVYLPVEYLPLSILVVTANDVRG